MLWHLLVTPCNLRSRLHAWNHDFRSPLIVLAVVTAGAFRLRAFILVYEVIGIIGLIPPSHNIIILFVHKRARLIQNIRNNYMFILRTKKIDLKGWK